MAALPDASHATQGRALVMRQVRPKDGLISTARISFFAENFIGRNGLFISALRRWFLAFGAFAGYPCCQMIFSAQCAHGLRVIALLQIKIDRFAVFAANLSVMGIANANIYRITEL